MTYAIIGSGAIGTALATQFAHNDIDVLVANSRGPASLAELVGRLGKNITAASVHEAIKADIVILAVPFGSVPQTVRDAAAWNERIIVDATNAIDFPAFTPKDLGGRLSTEVVTDFVPGHASSRHSTRCRQLFWPAILRRTADIGWCLFQATMPRPKPTSRY
jgi:8-hydroxy-5-deazaflavin:NADPH oxidoreductase